MASAVAGWYDDGSGTMKWWDGEKWTDTVQPQGSASSVAVATPQSDASQGLHYVVVQVILKEKFFGSGSGNLTELESAINVQVRRGYRLHTISTTSSGTKGAGGGDRIQATMVFERLV